MADIHIDRDIQRRFILGRQGLWPGRRFAGQEGTARALRLAEMVQIDPLNVVGRSHDLVLHSRVEGYRPEHLDDLMHGERQFFDWGGTVFIYPMSDLPVVRLLMRRRLHEARRGRFLEAHPGVMEQVLEEIRMRGPLGHRDLKGSARLESYHARKDTGMAMYLHWLAGDLMTHHRQRFERKFDLPQNIVPDEWRGEAPEEEAERRLVLKQAAFWGLCRERLLGGLLERRLQPGEAHAWAQRLQASGDLLSVQVEGSKELLFALAQDASLLEELCAGRLPAAWQPLGPTTREEVTFLAPLEIVSARGRSLPLFGFEYIWEVYKPAAQRRWGYYTLPILYGDRLAARLDPRVERSSRRLFLNGFWLEEERSAEDELFIAALRRGLLRLMSFAGAERLELRTHLPPRLQEALKPLEISTHQG